MISTSDRDVSGVVSFNVQDDAVDAARGRLRGEARGSVSEPRTMKVVLVLTESSYDKSRDVKAEIFRSEEHQGKDGGGDSDL